MKPLFVISCPFDTYSGYGARSRDLVKAIIETDKYNVKILAQRWGNTPWGFCKDNPEWGFLYNHTMNMQQQHPQPDVWMQITVPNEFQPVGKYNIGCTAGIESDICPAEWIEGINRMNLTIGLSNHVKKIFEETKMQKRFEDGRTENPDLSIFVAEDEPAEPFARLLGAALAVENRHMLAPADNAEIVEVFGQVPGQFAVGELVADGETRLLGPNTNLNAFEDFRTDLTGPALALITLSRRAAQAGLIVPSALKPQIFHGWFQE